MQRIHWNREIVTRQEQTAAAAASAAAAVEGHHLLTEEQTEAELKFLEDIAPKLVRFHRESIGGAERVHSRLQSPDDLAETASSLLAHGRDDRGPAFARWTNSPSTPRSRPSWTTASDPRTRSSSTSSTPASTPSATVSTARVGAQRQEVTSKNVEVAPVADQIEKAVLAKTARTSIKSQT